MQTCKADLRRPGLIAHEFVDMGIGQFSNEELSKIMYENGRNLLPCR